MPAHRYLLAPAVNRGEYRVAESDTDGVIGMVQYVDGVIKALSVLPQYRRRGVGRALVESCPGPLSLKCPSDLEANAFYQSLGFKEESCSLTPRGRLLVHYARPS